MASFYFHQKWCVIFWKFFLGCGWHQLLREGCVLPANACALSSWLENALKMKKAPRTQDGTEQESPLCVCPSQTQRAALSLPCNPTWGDASEGMRKRRQGVFKKSFHISEAPEALQQRRTRAHSGLCWGVSRGCSFPTGQMPIPTSALLLLCPGVPHIQRHKQTPQKHE